MRPRTLQLEIRYNANSSSDSMQYLPTQQVSQQPGQIPDLSNIDPSTYMSPMDLYDSIFWGEYTSPWPGGLNDTAR